MSLDVVGVHGIWNWSHFPSGDAATLMAEKWRAYLDMESLEIAYYAKQLQSSKQAAYSDDLERLDQDWDGLASDFLSIWIRSVHGQLGGGPQGNRMAPIRQLVSWLVSYYGAEQKVVNRFLGRFMEEVLLYFEPTQQWRRSASQLAVASAISLHRPRVVVAHSLGSVVAYETLSTYPGLRIELLITVGSPLGLPDVVFDRLKPAAIESFGQRPNGVARWVNVADAADLVAVPKHLGGKFRGVEDDIEVSAGPLFTHGVRKYLQNETVRDLVKNALSSPRPR